METQPQYPALTISRYFPIACPWCMLLSDTTADFQNPHPVPCFSPVYLFLCNSPIQINTFKTIQSISPILRTIALLHRPPLHILIILNVTIQSRGPNKSSHNISYYPSPTLHVSSVKMRVAINSQEDFNIIICISPLFW